MSGLNNSSSNGKKNIQKVDKTKFKTEMCKNWIEIGHCRYGNKCQFAHGDFELMGKNAPANAKYKSKICTTFTDKLFCPYGQRCLFKHEDRTLEEIKIYNHYIDIHFFQEKYLKNLEKEESETTEKANNTKRL